MTERARSSDAASGVELRALVVDDVAPALDELCQLLNETAGVQVVGAAGDALTALRLIQGTPLDVVFLDISMPGMDGLELAGLLGRMTNPPSVVFVTAFEQHAVSAYGVGAVDYLLKPVSAGRLAAALGRVHRVGPSAGRPRRRSSTSWPRSRSSWVDALGSCAARTCASPRRTATTSACTPAAGDTSSASRSLGWRSTGVESGYVRVHRSYLLAVHAVQELRSDVSGGLLAHTDVGDVPVSRRHARELRDLLLDAATRGVFDPATRRDGR